MPPKNFDNMIPVVKKMGVKYKDIFNVSDLYQDLLFWIKEYNWKGVDEDGNPDPINGADGMENLYLQRLSGDGAREEFWQWRLQKIPDGNSYVKYHLDVNAHVLGLKSTEVVRDNKKLKAHKGEIEFTIQAFIQYDYKGEWKKHKILKFFNEIFPKRIYKKELLEQKKLELYREVYIFHDYIKKWFQLKTFLPYEEVQLFHPSKAYPAWKK